MPAIQNKLPAFARGRNKALISLKFKTCAKNVVIFTKHNCDTLGWRLFFKVGDR